MRRRSRGRGFTLLELLVALAVFAVLAVAAYGGLRSVLETRAGVEREAQRLGQVQMALTLLERDLLQAIGRPIRDEYGSTLPALSGGLPGVGGLELTRAGWANPLNQRRAGLQRVRWEVSAGALLRSYWTLLDRNNLLEPRQLELMEQVQELNLRFLDEGDEWQFQWPGRDSLADSHDRLPRAVEVTLVLEDWGDITRLFILPDNLPQTGPIQPGAGG